MLTERAPGPTGADAVELLIAPNPGVPAGPLREIASGGELSRVMLALITASTEGEGTIAQDEREPAALETLVFDEIDAGIGGHTARAVGERLQRLGESRQVVCITHLPQIASLGVRHFSIVKDTLADPTLATVVQLGEPQVVSELVRMLGADDTDATARRHARGSTQGGLSQTRRPERMRGSPGRHAGPSGGTRRHGGPANLGHAATRAGNLATMAATRQPRGRDAGPAGSASPESSARPADPVSPPDFAAIAPWRTVTGPARLGRRTKLLVRHLVRGEVAVIDHLDIDRVSAEELIAAGATAVLNCRSSSSGSYPNLGPQLLVEAGIHLVDLPDDALFGEVSDGEALTVSDGRVLRGDTVLAEGEVLDLARVRAETEARRREVGEALERFAHNTIEHMREERELLAGRIDLPRFATDFRDRSALVVVRGVDHQRDLRALRPFIRDMRPVLVAVDGGAEALLEAGLSPDMIVGDMDSAGEAALRCGAELVVHSYPDGRAPGRARLDELGVSYKLVPAPGTSQDVAMLLAAEKGARLIVAVGSQFNLVEFLDRNREGMSSTFLTRLRIGEILVDAKGVSRLYHPARA